MPTIIIPPAGQTIPRVEKFANECIIYTLDCSKLLDPNELIIKAESSNASVLEIRPRKGITIEVQVSTQSLSTETYIDIPIQIVYNTSTGNSRNANFLVRVHR